MCSTEASGGKVTRGRDGIKVTAESTLVVALRRGKITIERFGPCVYEAQITKGGYQLGGRPQLAVRTFVGRRNSTLSNVTCSGLRKQPFRLERGRLVDQATGELYESEYLTEQA